MSPLGQAIQGGGEEDLISFIRALTLSADIVCGLIGNASQHGAIQPQVGKLALVQFRQFIQCLPVEPITGKPGFCLFEPAAKQRSVIQRR